MSTFREVFRFEISYRLRQPSTWLYLLATALLAWLLMSETLIDEARSSGNIHANAPALVAFVMTMATMLLLAVTAGLFGDAAARDLEAHMHPLVYSSPVSKPGYLGGRFAAAFVINAALMAIVPIGLACVEIYRSTDPQLFGPFRVATFIQPYFIIILPTVFATAAVMFAMAALTGRAFSAWITGAFLFFTAMLSEELLAERMEKTLIGTLCDPFAFTALSELAQYWTPFEKNTRLVPLNQTFVFNRLVWMGIAGVALAITYWRTRLDESEGAQRRSKPLTRPSDRPLAPGEGSIRPASREFGRAMQIGNVLRVAQRSLSDVFATRFCFVLVALSVIFILFGAFESAGVIFETPTWPMTYLIARDVVGDATVLILLLITVFAGELVWRERDYGLDEITGAVPLPDWVHVLGKFAAMVVALAILQTILMVSGMVLQSMQDYYDFEPALYLRILFGIQLTDYVLWSSLAFLIHVVVNQKYVAHLVFVLYWAFYRFGRYLWDVEDNLLVFPAAPPWSYSDISGFEPFLGPWLAFKVYWIAWAVLFGVVTTMLWVRGRQRTIRWSPAIVPAAIAVLATGGYVFYNTHVLNEYRARGDRNDVRAEYERLYKQYENLPQPMIDRVSLRVELFPKRRAAGIRGSYFLENRSDSPISTVHILTHEDVHAKTLTFDRAARRTHDDKRRRYQIFRLAQPLQRGESMRLDFQLSFAPRGFANGGARTDVLDNGTYFNRNWMPVIGYQSEFELVEDRARADRGLRLRKRLPKMNDVNGLRSSGNIRDASWMDLDVVIGTEPDQTALAPGSLRRTWNENGRRYFHYITDAPIQNQYGIFSAAYAAHRERWNGIDIEIYYHPRHSVNIGRIAKAMKATVDYHTKYFGPYPHKQLRIVEFPRHAGTYARAYPSTIAFSEGFGFMAKVQDGIDYPFLVAAHEVSHQWWGNQLRPARVEGGPVLAETMAHYGAMMVAEKEYGPRSLDGFRRMLLHKYLVGRQNSRSGEVPLLTSNDHKHIHYDKGGFVMYALRDYVGEEQVNTALRRLFEKHRFGDAPYPTTGGLLAELKAVTPESLQYLLKDLVEDITLWELKAKDAKVETARDGYRVTFMAQLNKLKPDEIGRDRAAPMNDLIEVGVFAGDDTLYLAKHRFAAGEQMVTVTVPRRPTRVGIDPFYKLIDREFMEANRADNLVEVETETRH